MLRTVMTSCLALTVFGLGACSQEENVTKPSENTTKSETSAPEITKVILPGADDPHIWMEEVEGERALSWVEAQNERSLADLQANPVYAELEGAALDIVNSDERIAYGSVRNGEVYNFWQDETNVRGLWRRTSMDSYVGDNTDWETVLDFDQLAADEDKNWVFKGSNCYAPKGMADYKCMVTLSDGGKDASERREFDLTTKTFVEDGFYMPEAKSGVSWVNPDTLLVATDWGGDGSTLTESGYPTTVKLWTRGTPLEDAETVFEGEKTDVWGSPFVLEDEAGDRIIGAVRGKTFFTSEYFIYPNDLNPVKLPIPEKARPIGLFDGVLFFTIQEDWSIKEGEFDVSFTSGSLLGMYLEELIETGERPHISEIFVPNERQAIENVSMTNGQILINLNDNVRSRLMKIVPGEAAWEVHPVEGMPSDGTLGIYFADEDEDTVFINYEGYLTPDSLLRYTPSTGTVDTIKGLPEKFSSEGLVVHQREAVSSDGTNIPYFIVHEEGIELDGTTPTLLYGYGGFQISLNPSYSGLNGKLWMERGGAYVVANIRGGGEFGPEWHQAGLKTNRQIIYDDFIAVAEALIEDGVTSPEHLGIMGGSNGGLLMGVMLTQRPDLWNAVVIQVPLLDMLRYHKLLAGASWVGEYGDPDNAEEREWLENMSPYHNFDANADYPEAFFVTSTKDDRVHPGHARKMAKLFEDTGKPFLYYENIDGGHSAAANLKETAKRKALEFTYLTEKLMGEK